MSDTTPETPTEEENEITCMHCGFVTCKCPIPETPTAGQAEEKCTVPPNGWRCTRRKGHEGPCAAIPEQLVGSISFCSHPGCGYPDGNPCHGCGAVVPKGLPVMVHSDHKERLALASQLAQAQGEVERLKSELEEVRKWGRDFQDAHLLAEAQRDLAQKERNDARNELEAMRLIKEVGGDE